MNGFTDTGGTDSGGWFDVVTAGINAWSAREQSQEVTQQKQAESLANVMRFSDIQAKSAGYTATPGQQSQMMTTMLVIGGLLVGGLLIWKAVK